jgi:hypothetical protein
MKDEYNNTIPETREFGRWKASETSEIPTKMASEERKIDKSGSRLGVHEPVCAVSSLRGGYEYLFGVPPDPPGATVIFPLQRNLKRPAQVQD